MKDSALTSFLDLGLAEPIARALVDEQYTTPTPIQAQTIPQVLAARDVVGIAQTGTGKTAAFALPILNHLSKAPRRPEARSCRVLVLSPTRELSAQIVESFETYGRYLRPRVALAIGGVPLNRQIRALAGGVDVLVATPGRLLDLMQQRAVHLDRVEVFVLDEADRMLDMGFIHDIQRIVTKLPSRRQTLFFSATMPREIADLANNMLRDPVRVAVTPSATTVERIVQQVIHVDRAAKPALLAEILRREPADRVLVFTRTKRGADKVVRALAKSGLAAEAIHGNKSQNQRERVLAAFRTGEVRTLVATDIAARGIDVDGISHVVNYDLPNIPDSYVHRIGRTARAGADGVAISFCDAEERAFLRDIEKLIRLSIPATDRRSDQRSAPAHGAHATPQQRPKQNGGNGRQHEHQKHNGQTHDGARNNGQHRNTQARNSQPRNSNSPSRPRGAVAAAPVRDIGAMPFMQQPRRGSRRRVGGHGAPRASR
jgi:ATP-dependent RNA helicase RhlE